MENEIHMRRIIIIKEIIAIWDIDSFYSLKYITNVNSNLELFMVPMYLLLVVYTISPIVRKHL